MEFKKLDEIQKRILMEVADLHSVPEGAFNIRSDGQLAGRANSANTSCQDFPAVGNSSRCRIFTESASHSPTDRAHFVPPMSMPIDKLISPSPLYILPFFHFSMHDKRRGKQNRPHRHARCVEA